MAFLEQRLTDAVARGSRGGPRTARTKVRTQSGRLVQKFHRSLPLHSYDVSYGIKTQQNFEDVRAMWMLVMFTPYEGFRFRDWGDYKGAQGTTTLIDLGGGDWQLQRRYTVAGINFDRTITKPNADVVAYSGAGAALPTVVDTTTGIVTVTGTPAYWVGTFDVPVQFMDDAIDNIMLEGGTDLILQGLSSIKLEELPP
jgi:uncharacterized protein (TIGR02217 family)